ncbi:peptidase dimerization domain-containing protein [Streptomyces mutabilis]|uniref:peptidase dimerization domain-containing protein n=1 Tax=Streptomyces mutabilis TaxID=67332 RepID=UPI003985C11A
MTDPARTVLAGLDDIRSDLEDLYRDLHRHPELGLREHRTAKTAADALRESIVSRELAATTPAVVTVGSVHAGSSPNVIPDRAVIELNVRTYDDVTRARVLDAIERIVKAECEASRTPEAPEIERLSSFPPTVNDEEPTRRVADAFAAYFGDDAHTVERQTASEDMSEIPRAFGVPFTYWMIGGTDPERYAEAAKKGTVAQDIPVNHSATFAPVVQPTLDTGVSAVTVAALAWLGDRAA